MTAGKPNHRHRSINSKLTIGGCYVIAKRNQGKLKHSVNGLGTKFKRMSEVYRIFSRHWEHVLDFSDEALIELYNGESFGTPVSGNNGYGVGKMYLNVHVKMWKEDIALGLLFKRELYEDGLFPHWWLDSVFKVT